ncbi:hypothetical protein U6A24_12610 [Aquimarina gracilis]|uniref:Uncharacterized protein n=1 Tax=Aquimarina gracilis TaxID=874422 RepID=A0ABU5ZWS6_9FLAO|nr:hypothetical protein [Aquimarina gracilis]MEB3346311.1 hypothetical protein [Aquimarina gracilis]
MLLLGKTAYRLPSVEGSGGKTPIEIDLGSIQIAGETPTKDELAIAINSRGVILEPNQLPVFKVKYSKRQDT